MDRGPRALGAFVAGVVLIVGACATGTPTPTQPAGVVGPTPAPTPSTLAVATGTLTPAATSTVAPSAGTPAPAGGSVTGSAPTPTPNSNPVKPPAPPAGWTVPRQVSKVSGCYQLTAGIDVASRYHIAAECGQSIRYFVSNTDGSWTGTLFARPAKRQDLDPQLAFRGNVVYVAFSRIAPDGACGGGYGRTLGSTTARGTNPGAHGRIQSGSGRRATISKHSASTAIRSTRSSGRAAKGRPSTRL